jgi:hypothetical protein
MIGATTLIAAISQTVRVWCGAASNLALAPRVDLDVLCRRRRSRHDDAADDHPAEVLQRAGCRGRSRRRRRRTRPWPGGRRCKPSPSEIGARRSSRAPRVAIHAASSQSWRASQTIDAVAGGCSERAANGSALSRAVPSGRRSRTCSARRGRCAARRPPRSPSSRETKAGTGRPSSRSSPRSRSPPARWAPTCEVGAAFFEVRSELLVEAAVRALVEEVQIVGGEEGRH